MFSHTTAAAWMFVLAVFLVSGAGLGTDSAHVPGDAVPRASNQPGMAGPVADSLSLKAAPVETLIPKEASAGIPASLAVDTLGEESIISGEAFSGPEEWPEEASLLQENVPGSSGMQYYDSNATKSAPDAASSSEGDRAPGASAAAEPDAYIEPDIVPDMVPVPLYPPLDLPDPLEGHGFNGTDPFDDEHAASKAGADTIGPAAQDPASTSLSGPDSIAPDVSPSPANEGGIQTTPDSVKATPIRIKALPGTPGTDPEGAISPQSNVHGGSGFMSFLRTPSYELSLGSITVDGQQWTRFGLGFEVPIWRLAAFFDIEFFLDNDGRFSSKGWEFDQDNWGEALFRKIRYLRYGTESEPVSAKLGGLGNVTFGYGLVVDRFTNMLHYPDQKLLGLQFNLNNFGNHGMVLQSVVADVGALSRGGGVFGLRIGAKPLINEEVSAPLANMVVAAGFMTDRNQYAPARDWRFEGDLRDYVQFWRDIKAPKRVIDSLVARKQLDTTLDMSKIDTTFQDSVASFTVLGLDASIPVLSAGFLGIDIYAQAASRLDREGWAMGFPGVALTTRHVRAQLEYRHVSGMFQPGHFGFLYLDERVTRYPVPAAKSDLISSSNLNGIYGAVDADVLSFVTLRLGYQNLSGKSRADHRLEFSAAVGERLVRMVPKVTSLEAYYSKSDMPRNWEHAFDFSTGTRYGYRLGIEVGKGAAIILDTQYGFEFDITGKLVPINRMIMQTSIRF